MGEPPHVLDPHQQQRLAIHLRGAWIEHSIRWIRPVGGCQDRILLVSGEQTLGRPAFAECLLPVGVIASALSFSLLGHTVCGVASSITCPISALSATCCSASAIDQPRQQQADRGLRPPVLVHPPLHEGIEAAAGLGVIEGEALEVAPEEPLQRAPGAAQVLHITGGVVAGQGCLHHQPRFDRLLIVARRGGVSVRLQPLSVAHHREHVVG